MENTATFRQRMMLYRLSKVDNRGVAISKEVAADIISDYYKGEDVTERIAALVGTAPPAPTKEDKTREFQRIYQEAVDAANEAAAPVTHEFWCGFAWVNIKPATTAFARWMKQEGHARRDSYYGGITVWCPLPTQSMVVKEVWAQAFSSVLQQHGYKAQAMSRDD